MLYVQDHNTLKYRKTKGKKIVFIQMMTVQLVNDLTIKTVHKKVMKYHVIIIFSGHDVLW